MRPLFPPKRILPFIYSVFNSGNSARPGLQAGLVLRNFLLNSAAASTPSTVAVSPATENFISRFSMKKASFAPPFIGVLSRKFPWPKAH